LYSEFAEVIVGYMSIESQFNLNSPNSNQELVYEFDNFRLDSARLMLYHAGRELEFAPKVVETLLALVERRGAIVSNEEIFSRVWKESYVDRSNLTQNIYLLRKALGNMTNGQPFIETFRRRGYRFNGRLKPQSFATSDEAVEDLAEKVREDAFAPTSSYKSKRSYLLAGVVAVCGLMILAGFGVARFFSSNSQTEQILEAAPRSNVKITRLTPDINASASALTPDGNHLAYNLSYKGKHSVWLKDLATGSSTQILPPTDEAYASLNFSSDGKTLYYVSSFKDAPNGTIVRVSLTDGRLQKITSDVINSFTLSPDENRLAFINSKGQLLIAQTDGSGESVLATRDNKNAWYAVWGATMSWSPDGNSVVLCGGKRDDQGRTKPELIEVMTVDGSERLIPIPDWNYLEDAVWLRDQTGLLVVARETETAPFQIWRLSYPKGIATRVTSDTNSYDDIVLSSDGHMLVAQQRFENLNVWTVPLDNSSRAKQITFGNAASDGNFGIAFTPDGKIIYTSPRDGKVDLWVTGVNESVQRQLTKNAGDYNGRPNVSPDNRFIVFTSSRSGVKQIWRMDTDGGNPKQLTKAEILAEGPNLSPDGSWIYYSLNEGDTASIWKIRSDGGEPVAVSRNIVAWSPSVSPDGKFIAYQFYDKDTAKPWKVGVLSAETGESLKTFDTLCFRHLTFWTADSKSIVYMKGESANLWQLPIDGGESRQVTNFESGRIYNFALSPDFKHTAVSRGNPSKEAVLITNF
jgi:Tol biopolymer transport system component/DNA-binding winged helix-turn-helix (wHTH) protein